MPLTLEKPRTNVATGKQPEAEPRDNARDAREFFETIIFVLVLVNLLRMFGAEAFVIPTGSMATTLLGAHKTAVCPQCGYRSQINASQWVDYDISVDHGTCQNCRYPLDEVIGGTTRQRPSRGFKRMVLNAVPQVLGRIVTGYANPHEVWDGDRVLVSKYVYDGFQEPERWDVAVFKYPPVSAWGERNHTALTNYIKRLIGKPNEIIRIFYGDVLVKAGDASDFVTAQKPPDVVLAVRRLVYDNDLPPLDMLEEKIPRRWQAEKLDDWEVSKDGKSFTPRATGSAWINYFHITGGAGREGNTSPRLITDFESYNSGGRDDRQQHNWVGDLNLDAVIDVRELKGKVILELGESVRRYQCVLDLGEKKVNLLQDGKIIASNPSPIAAAGAWTIRFTNFDDRLTVWINDRLPFGAGVAIASLAANEQGPRRADLQPVRVGSEGAAVTVRGLKIYRDLYYTQTAKNGDGASNHYFAFSRIAAEEVIEEWRIKLERTMQKPAEFPLKDGEYFMLGDNSTSSSDSREWDGTHVVPRRLLLGRALFLYWPPWSWKFVL